MLYSRFASSGANSLAKDLANVGVSDMNVEDRGVVRDVGFDADLLWPVRHLVHHLL